MSTENDETINVPNSDDQHNDCIEPPTDEPKTLEERIALLEEVVLMQSHCIGDLRGVVGILAFPIQTDEQYAVQIAAGAAAQVTATRWSAAVLEALEGVPSSDRIRAIDATSKRDAAESMKNLEGLINLVKAQSPPEVADVVDQS
ncbi:hypothetical protein LCGC14_0920080, partial [marine sediment metagenome]